MLLRTRPPLPAARLQRRCRRATQVQAAARLQQQPLTPPPVGTPLSAKKPVSQAKTPAKTHRSSVERARFDAAAQAALPLHPDPFQRAQYHEVRVEALLVGCALVASLWVSLLRRRGSLFPEGEEGYLARVSKAHAASLPKPRGGAGLDFGWPGKALAAAALAAADAVRPAPPPRALPPLNLASSPSPSPADQSLAALVAEAQALQATMDAETARLAALEAARVQAAEEDSAAVASAERAREAVNAAAAAFARAERETQDASYPVKAALAYAPLLPELAAQALDAASETVRKLAKEARQRIEDAALDAPLAAAAEEPVLPPPPPPPPPSSASPELARMLAQAEALQARMDAEAARLKRQDAAAAEQRRADVRQLAAQLGVSPQRPDKGASFPVAAAAAVASVAAMKGRKAE